MYLKLSAACSPDEQPNDSARSFPILKQFEKSIRANEVEVLKPRWLDGFSKWLTNRGIFDAASRRCVLQFMWNIEVILGKAYTPQIIQSSYRVTGVAPYSALRICQHYPRWKTLSQRDGNSILRSISSLSKIALSTPEGYLTEEILTSFLAPIVGPPSDYVYANFEENCLSDYDGDVEEPARKHRKLKPLNERPVNHQRAICLNGKVFMAAQLLLRTQKRMEAEAAMEKKRVRSTVEGRMTVAQLKNALGQVGLPSNGNKETLIQRLILHTASAQDQDDVVILRMD